MRYTLIRKYKTTLNECYNKTSHFNRKIKRIKSMTAAKKGCKIFVNDTFGIYCDMFVLSNYQSIQYDVLNIIFSNHETKFNIDSIMTLFKLSTQILPSDETEIIQLILYIITIKYISAKHI